MLVGSESCGYTSKAYDALMLVMSPHSVLYMFHVDFETIHFNNYI